MALTQEDWVKHQQKQTDLKGFLNVLAPFVNSEDTELKEMATKKVKELIPQIDLSVKESAIKAL